MTFDLQPALNGSLVQLRALRAEDFPELYEAASDPLIWEQHPESDRYTLDVFQKYFDRILSSSGALAVIDRKSGRIIGSSTYYDFAPERREVAVGFTFLKRAFWGGPVNRELKQLMLGHAFQSIDRVVFHVGESNHRSRKALEKIGARVLTKIESRGSNGQVQPSLVFIIEKKDWEAR
jgi:RimJ/RimL family protein N-acetyltransferase